MSHATFESRKRYRVARAMGYDTSPIDSARTTEHVRALNSHGFSSEVIAEAAGLTGQAIRNIRDGRYGTVRRRTAWAVLNVTAASIFAKANDDDLVPSYAARRRIEALRWNGWTALALDEWDGCTVTSHIGRSDTITARNHRHVKAVFDELWDVKGGSMRGRARAIGAGFAPPLAWDDIDDPDAVPDLGDRVQGVDLDEFVFLLRHGVSIPDAAARLGVQPDSIYVQARRQERPDVLDLINITRRAA